MNLKIYKSEKKLELWDQDQLIHSFPIGIGKVPVGPKLLRGDLKTPEGNYKICVKNPKSKFYLGLGLNYPNQTDAELALTEGRIGQHDYQRIVSAIQEGKGSPWDTPLGGAIYIHGDLESKDWSEGCIRMYNKDVMIIYELSQIGDEVIILA